MRPFHLDAAGGKLPNLLRFGRKRRQVLIPEGFML
jgi:hypothetical protein